MQSVPNTMAEALALASEQEDHVSKINIASGEDVVLLDYVNISSGEDAFSGEDALVFEDVPVEEEA